MRALTDAVGPARTVLFGSLLLSFISIQQNIINRDGILYVETAYRFMEGEFQAAVNLFNWPTLPFLMAMLSKLTGLHPELAGHVLNALFMAGACVLLLLCIIRDHPQMAWPASLVILALPGFNGYREELLREYGMWFFVMLSFWMALRWEKMPGWLSGLWIQLAIVVASLFRPEALAFFCALWGWQFYRAPKAERWQRISMLSIVPLVGLIAVVTITVIGGKLPDRLLSEFGRLKLTSFESKASALAVPLIKYAKGNAGAILFFGSIALVPLKFAIKLGVFLIPLGYAFLRQGMGRGLKTYSLFAWAFLMYFLVLAVFTLDYQFLAGRYLVLLFVFSSPFVTLGTWLMIQRFPGAIWMMVTVAVLILVSNVISLGPGRVHYIQAGKWLADNWNNPDRVYVGEPRIAYYAGQSFIRNNLRPKSRHALSHELALHNYDVIVLSVSREGRDLEEWLKQSQLKVTQRFTGEAGDDIVVAVPEFH